MSLDVRLWIDVDTGGNELFRVDLFKANITHNLGTMARKAEMYTELWHPEELDIKQAGDLIPAIEAGLAWMKDDPDYFKTFDSENGWGIYDDFVPWVENYLEACKQHPWAVVETWT